MYIGGTDERALHHCVSEVLDNSVDEHLAGYCNRIEVTIHVDGSISIRDNGRGIPVDIHPEYKIPGVEMVLTTLHSGGKYGQGGYKFSGGTHGVGAKCVNAVSEWFEVEVSRDGQVHHMEFERGKTTKKLEVIGKAKGTGHAHHVQARPGDFPGDDRVQSRTASASGLRELAFLNSGLEIIFLDERVAGRQARILLLQGRHRGIREAAQQGQDSRCIRSRSVQRTRPTSSRRTEVRHSEIHVDVVMQYNDSYNDSGPVLHQHRSQSRRRHASVRLSQRADPGDQSIRQVKRIC